MRGRRRRALLVTVLAVVIGVGGLAPTARAGTASFPHFTGLELKAFYYASQPLPGTQKITSRPSIYGDAAADRRIQQLAEARGYRLQVTPTVALGSYGGVTLAADAGQAWVALLAAARSHGTPLQGNSGYRSVATQREIFRRRLGGWSTSQIASGAADDAIESVLAYHSIPGYSRHHTGKTLDLSAAGGSNGSFASTAAYSWLSADNYQIAKSFGFIPNYPPGAGAQGPNPEPWEFVYVGVPRIRCAIQVVPLADPDAASICGLADVPIVGELTGDDNEDVFVYRPGSRPEGFFPGTSDRTATSWPASSVTGRYQPLIGDFRGDGIADILWYAPGSARDHLWTFSANAAHVSHEISVGDAFRPVVGDFNGNGRDDVFWYAPGSAPDTIWYHRADGTHTSIRVSVVGHYLPVAGDFNGDGVDDILWYAPGQAADYLWLQHLDATHTSVRLQVIGSYVPAAGDFDGDGVDDILWYAPGSPRDYVWFQHANASHTSREHNISGRYTVGTGDHDGDGRADVVFVAPPGGQDSVWFGTSGGGFTKMPRRY